MTRIVCGKCKQRMFLDKVGIALVSKNPATGTIFRIEIGDRYKCSSCGNTIIAEIGKPMEYGLYTQEQLLATINNPNRESLEMSNK